MSTQVNGSELSLPKQNETKKTINISAIFNNNVKTIWWGKNKSLYTEYRNTWIPGQKKWIWACALHHMQELIKIWSIKCKNYKFIGVIPIGVIFI